MTLEKTQTADCLPGTRIPDQKITSDVFSKRTFCGASPYRNSGRSFLQPQNFSQMVFFFSTSVEQEKKDKISLDLPVLRET